MDGQVRALAERIMDNVSQVIVGKKDVIRVTLSAVLAGGHILTEDVPGTGKTMLARALARSIDGNFSRIQFTPDLLPTDVTGVSVYNPKDAQFVFKPGPVFANVVLADEINRATPRAQSAMLECMEEKQVSTDGVTYALPEPFFVIATQNPVETQGTFPLPEAQLDRFMVKLSMGYPTMEEMCAILLRNKDDVPVTRISPVATAAQVHICQQQVRTCAVHESLMEYISALCAKTRELDDVLLGASPRAAIALMRASQAYAAIAGRNYITPEDIRALAVPVLAHRLILRASFGQSGKGRAAVEEVLATVPVPTENVS